MKPELEMIKYLISEIEEYTAYREERERLIKKAEKQAEAYNASKRPDDYTKHYWDFMSVYERKPLSINDNLKLIRRLCLKLYR